MKQCKEQKKTKPHKKREEREKKLDNEETTTVAEEPIVFSAKDQPCICMICHDSDWLIGSEATHHTTQRRDVFVAYHNEIMVQ